MPGSCATASTSCPLPERAGEGREPKQKPQRKRVLVVLRLSRRRAAQGLRAAVAYAAVGLDVTVALCGPQEALLQAEAERPLRTLRALGHGVKFLTEEASLAALFTEASPDAVVVW